MNRRSHPSQAGMTLIEMIVVMAIALIIILASFQMIEETTRVTMFIETRNDLPLIGQEAVNTIQTALTQSRQIFDADTSGVGPGYFSAVSLTVPLLTGSKLPKVNSAGQFLADTSSSEFAGNCLLIARQTKPIAVSYTGGSLTVDKYRFEMFYLTKSTAWKFTGYDGYIDAMRARSVEYADYFQLSTLSLTTTQRKELNDKLIAANIKLAWNPGQPIGSAIYTINSNGTSAGAYTLNATPAIALNDQVKSITPKINGGRVFGRSSYSIAFRPSSTKTYPIPTPIARYAYYNSGQPLYPSGLEFMVVGSANTRRVLSRMVIMAHYRANEYASQEASVITSP